MLFNFSWIAFVIRDQEQKAICACLRRTSGDKELEGGFMKRFCAVARRKRGWGAEKTDGDIFQAPSDLPTYLKHPLRLLESRGQ